MENLPIESFSLSGYRSFGAIPQRFERLSKINLLIGQNNCGKSNVLRFLRDIYPRLSSDNHLKLEQLEKHLPSNPLFTAGIGFSMEKDETENYSELIEHVYSKLPEQQRNTQDAGYLKGAYEKKAEFDDSKLAWFDYGENLQLISTDWKNAFDSIPNREMQSIWHGLCGGRGGSRDSHWFPESLNILKKTFLLTNVELIPAIRKVDAQGSTSDDFSGTGIIERLVRLQNPDVHNQIDRIKFDRINEFLRSVTDSKSATIEIPHERDTILVHMDGKTLPLDSLGTGIHEVIILAAASTILENTVICMEEPELHLNPLLQKKLVRYLDQSTSNQYFITTHSAALMDTPKAEIFHVTLENGESKVVNVSSDKQRSETCRDLGYYPSDLLQANCIIWVEGPSDRIYLNFWIKSLNSELVEGVHYSIIFYGGRLASHLSGNDYDEAVDDFISLRRLNRCSVIIIDSDKGKSTTRINATKKRLKTEFNDGPGYAWVTKGREIENYIPDEILQSAIQAVAPSAKLKAKMGQYENNLSITIKNGKKSQAPKVKVAKYIAENTEPDLNILDLHTNLNKLIRFINESNE